MTGGQMAPTTLLGQKTTTSPLGRNAAYEGYPIDMCNLIKTLRAPVYVVRTKVTNSRWILKTKSYLKRAITLQIEKKGYSFVEILSNCNTNWKVTPSEANRWIEETMEKEYPLGVFVDAFAEKTGG
jgi:2-oxoglutarate ferredoxin oxidoreductase subunit beta